MADIVPFVTKNEHDAKQNRADFVELCRNKLEIFGADLKFDDNNWDVRDYIQLTSKPGARVGIEFSNFDSSKASRTRDYMKEPFCSFAKAYIRYMHGLRPSKAFGNRLIALRAIEHALRSISIDLDIADADINTFAQAGKLIQDRYKSTAYRIAAELQQIAEFCTERHLVVAPILWKSHIKRGQDGNRIGLKADKDRISKMPSAGVLEALPKAYHLAKTPQDIILSSAYAILCSSPDRVNELLRLPLDCKVKQTHKDKTVYGLRWSTSKGGKATVKWLAPSMAEIANQALDRIVAQTEEARKVAKWYETYPDKIYEPTEMDGINSQKELNLEELSAITGLTEASVRAWCSSCKINIKAGKFSTSQVVEKICEMLPRSFPILDKKTGLKYSEALFVTNKNLMHPNRGTWNCMIEYVSTAQINDGLGAGIAHGRFSMFSRLELTEDDGSPLKATSHQFRHWLNTLAQRGGMSQLDIAKWSGRVNIHQNKDYDHMTADELCGRLRQIVCDDINIGNLPVETREKINNPVTRDEFTRMMIPSAHVTELGFCIHDYTFTPCQLHRDCISCSEHCYIKGDQKRMERIRKNCQELEYLLEQSRKDQEDGCYGADRWSEHHEGSYARLRNLVEIFDNPDIPDGSLLRLATAEPPSQIRFAIEDRKKLDPKAPKALPAGEEQ